MRRHAVIPHQGEAEDQEGEATNHHRSHRTPHGLASPEAVGTPVPDRREAPIGRPLARAQIRRRLDATPSGGGRTTAMRVNTRGWIGAVVIAAVAMAPGARKNRRPSSPTRRSRSLRVPKARPERTFTAFESGQVRPLALSPTRSYSSRSTRPTTGSRSSASPASSCVPVGSVPVGLEPVAVAARTDDEVWVVNHLSDSVSIVDVSRPAARARGAHAARRRRAARHRVRRAGPTRAFITTAHRGQNTGRDPQLTTPGVGRADVWVFDAAALGHVAGRHAADRHHPVRRHAARARGHARRRHASTPPASTPATGPPSINERHRHAQRLRGRRRSPTRPDTGAAGGAWS